MKTLVEALRVVFILTAIWFGVSNMIQSFMCPELTKMQLFLRTGKNMICDFKVCWD